VAALRCEGIDAPCVFDGPVNGESFKAYVERCSPRRCAPATSSSWITSAHTKAARSVAPFAPLALASCSCRLTRPISIPSILRRAQEAFAKLKTPIRKAEERTVDGLWRRIGGLLEAFTPGECENYLRNAGYAST
jgi:hypothetical protein